MLKTEISRNEQKRDAISNYSAIDKFASKQLEAFERIKTVNEDIIKVMDRFDMDRP